MWNAMKKKGAEAAQLLQTLNDPLFEGGGFLHPSAIGREEEGPEEGYRAALIHFQFDQIRITKEYQKVIGEKDAELLKIKQMYESETGKKLLEDEIEKKKATALPVLADIGDDPMKAYQGMNEHQLRAQVEVLLDSVKSWEERVTELVQAKADEAAQTAQMKIQLNRSQQRIGDLVDRIKLQQSELEKYIALLEDYKAKTVTDTDTIESLVKDYSNLVVETQITEDKNARHTQDLKNNNYELKTKLAAYERNILQLIDTQAEIQRQQQQQQAGQASGISTSSSDAAQAIIDALQKQLVEKEEAMKQIIASSSSSTTNTSDQPAASKDPELASKLEQAEAENDRIRKDLERTRKSLEQAQKAGEKLGKDNASLRGRRQDEEKAEAALREEVTELQAKLEAAYKTSSQHGALKDKITRLEQELKAVNQAHESAGAEAVVKLEAEKEALMKQSAEAIQAAKADHEKAMSTLVKEWEAKAAEWGKEKEGLGAQQGDAVQAAITKGKQTLAALQVELVAAQAKAVAETKEAAVQEAKRTMEEALKEAEKDKATALAKLQGDMEAALAAKNKELEAATAAIKTELTAEIALMEKARDEAKAALEKGESSFKAKQEAALQAQAEEMEKAKTRAVAEARAAMVDEAQKERAEALELYSQENRRRKQVHNKLLELQGNIRVVCRVRPVLPVEISAGEGADVTEIPTEEDIVVKRDPTTRAKFEFDRVFAPLSAQEEVFAFMKPVILSCMDGFNTCIFAYGQTGSGKTFTMEGPPENRGVNFRALGEIFELREERSKDVKYTIQMSMLEVYNETIRDLLGVKDGRCNSLPTLDIRMGVEGEYDVPGLMLEAVESMEEVVRRMNEGKANRAVGSHDMNEHSSRSHSILSIRIKGENLHDRSTTTSKLHLIDLAGSERVSKTDATGDRLKEAQNINKSLSALGDVISALGQKNKGHIPYRNSKLTFLLQDSLGGNSKVMMFVNISPAAYNAGETICSLHFASRCRAVQLGAAKKGGTDGEVIQLRERVEALEKELKGAEGSGGEGSPSGSGGTVTPIKVNRTSSLGARGSGPGSKEK